MKVWIVTAAGKKRHRLSDGVEEYIHRINRYCSGAEMIRFPDDAKASHRYKKALDGLKGRSFVIALEVHGESVSSEQHASLLRHVQNQGFANLVYLVGGSFGIPEEIRKLANREISLSKMTFTHHFVQLICAEQIYRAFTILRREPYSH